MEGARERILRIVALIKRVFVSRIPLAVEKQGEKEDEVEGGEEDESEENCSLT